MLFSYYPHVSVIRHTNIKVFIVVCGILILYVMPLSVLVVNVHFAFIFNVYVLSLCVFLLCICLSRGVAIYISRYLLTRFCLLNQQKIAKKKSHRQARFVVLRILVWTE